MFFLQIVPNLKKIFSNMLSEKKNPHRSGPHSSNLCCATATYMIIFMYLTMYESHLLRLLSQKGLPNSWSHAECLARAPRIPSPTSGTELRPKTCISKLNQEVAFSFYLPFWFSLCAEQLYTFSLLQYWGSFHSRHRMRAQAQRRGRKAATDLLVQIRWWGWRCSACWLPQDWPSGEPPQKLS